MKLRLVSPVRLFFGPIFQMEVRTAGRRTSTYVFRSFLAALILAFFSLVLLGSWSSVSWEESSLARLQAGQNIAPSLASYIIWTQYIALVLLAPIITGPALCDERRNRTMAALLTTPLSAWEIVLGKLSGRLTQALILALISTPMIFAARVLGGLSVEGVVAAVILTGISVILCSSLALLASAGSPRATTAASTGFMLFLFFNFGPLLLAVMYNAWIQPNFAGLPMIPWTWAFFTSLPFALGMVVLTHFGGAPVAAGSSTMEMWGYAALYGAALSSIAILLAGCSLRGAMRRSPDDLMSAPASKKKRKKRKTKRRKGEAAPEELTEAWSEDDEVQQDSREVSDRPVLWRETRAGAFRKRRRLIESLLVIFVVFGLMYYNGGLQEPAAHIIVAMVGGAILMIQAIFGTTGTIAHERESRTLDVLMTTPMRPRAIIWGKLLGSLRRLWFVPAVIGAHFVIGVAIGVFHPALLILAPIVMVPAVIFFESTGLLLSVVLRKGTSAAVANMFLALFVYLGAPLIMVIIQNVTNLYGSSSYDTIFTGIMIFNPFVMGGIALVGTGTLFDYSGHMSSPEFHMPTGEVGLLGFLVLICASGLSQIGCAFVALAAASRLLPERFGRSS